MASSGQALPAGASEPSRSRSVIVPPARRTPTGRSTAHGSMPPYQVTSAQAPVPSVPARSPTGCTGAVGPGPGFGVTRVAPPRRSVAPPPEPAGGEPVTPTSGPPLPLPAAA